MKLPIKFYKDFKGNKRSCPKATLLTWATTALILNESPSWSQILKHLNNSVENILFQSSSTWDLQSYIIYYPAVLWKILNYFPIFLFLDQILNTFGVPTFCGVTVETIRIITISWCLQSNIINYSLVIFEKKFWWSKTHSNPTKFKILKHSMYDTCC